MEELRKQRKKHQEDLDRKLAKSNSRDEQNQILTEKREYDGKYLAELERLSNKLALLKNLPEIDEMMFGEILEEFSQLKDYQQ